MDCKGLKNEMSVNALSSLIRCDFVLNLWMVSLGSIKILLVWAGKLHVFPTKMPKKHYSSILEK